MSPQSPLVNIAGPESAGVPGGGNLGANPALGLLGRCLKFDQPSELPCYEIESPHRCRLRPILDRIRRGRRLKMKPNYSRRDFLASWPWLPALTWLAPRCCRLSRPLPAASPAGGRIEGPHLSRAAHHGGPGGLTSHPPRGHRRHLTMTGGELPNQGLSKPDTDFRP
jgi:hypothetical protein